MRRFLEVDVFCSGPLTGNPLAIVADADGLDEHTMRRLAAWTGFSETTFLLPPNDPAADYRVRIFTPTTEYPFAGHPTLGSARAWLVCGGTPNSPHEIVQECDAGLVSVRRDGDVLAFATPPRTRTGPLVNTELQEVCEALGVDVEDVVAHAWGSNGPEWRLLQLRDGDSVRSLSPRPHRGNLRVGVVGLETAASDIACELRAFGPDYEDPVTGSLHGAMAQWLRERGLLGEHWVAGQGSQLGRQGRVEVHDDGHQIWIGGRAEVVVDGTIRLP